MKYNTAVVTGASRGLGRAIAQALALRGLNVILAGRSEQELAVATRSIGQETSREAAYFVTDLRAPDSIRALFSFAKNQFGPVDVLVNNAGVGTYKPLLEWNEQEIIDTIATNLTGLILCCKTVLPDMMQAKQGLIINIASDLSRRYLANMGPYVASKFGVLGFSGSLLREVRNNGIKVCTVMPGIIDTNFNNSREGTREEAWSLPPAKFAAMIAALLDQPDYMVLDEVTIHPLIGDY